jgi:hypothetical protein
VSIFSGNCHNKRIIPDTNGFGAPRRHTRFGVGPANSDKTFVSSLPAVSATAHPVGCIVQTYQSQPKFFGNFGCTVHGKTGV